MKKLFKLRMMTYTSIKKQFKYRSVVEMLLFLVKYSRPDILNAVRELSNSTAKQTTRTINRCNMQSITYISDVEVYTNLRNRQMGVEMNL